MDLGTRVCLALPQRPVELGGRERGEKRGREIEGGRGKGEGGRGKGEGEREGEGGRQEGEKGENKNEERRGKRARN